MSGFGIAVRWGTSPSPSEREGLLRGLARRGPHGLASRDVGEATLVHAALWATPESVGERQPLRHPSREWWITADLRLDNRDELIAEFGQGRVGGGISDAALALRAYERWGEAMVERLLGDFGFALWDAERRLVVLARDHLGVKPVHWARTPSGGFVAASTVSPTLRASGLVPARDEVYLAGLFSQAGPAQERTCWEGLGRLPPGHTMVVAADTGPRAVRYWTPRCVPAPASAREAATAIRAVTEEAVRCRLRTCGAVAAHVSGGHDSPTVFATARALSSNKLLGYALSFPGKDCDETTYIEVVESEVGVPIRKLDALAQAPHDFLAECRETLDLPRSPDAGWYLPLARWSVADGCTTLLSGQGGDQVLRGWAEPIMRDLALQGRWGELWRLVPDDGIAARVRRTGHLALWRAWIASLNSRVPGVSQTARYVRHKRRGAPPGVLGARLRNVAAAAPADLRADQGDWQSAQSGRLEELTGSWGTLVLEALDRIGEEAGIEVRSPLLDVRLVELSLSLDPRLLFADRPIAAGYRNERALHRLAFADLLPDDVLNRTDKTFFDGPLAAAMVDLAESLGARAGCEDLVRRAEVAARLDSWTSSGSVTGLWDVWAALAIEAWCASTNPGSDAL